ncbi:MAG: PD40 domain-containing protein [candidate division Zixibacteria bacterium]|nr:PD40 domain-containing protein [candidate division Zixibacteria bacterium]
MHRLKTSIVLLMFTAVIIASFFTVGFAGKQETAPGNTSAQIGKTDAGPRPLGQIAFISDGGIEIMDSDGGSRMRVSSLTNAYGRLSFSPDNKKIAFSRRGQDASKLPSDEGGAHRLHDVFIAFVDSAKTNKGWWNRVTFSLGGYWPEWSNNDTMIYYQNDINAGFVDYIVPSHQLALVSTNNGHADYFRKDWQSLSTNMIMPTFTGDGKKIAYGISYSQQEDKYSFQNFGVKIIDRKDIMIAEKDMKKASKGLERATAPQWSPDGEWLAYLNNDMRNSGIYIIKSDLSEKRLVFAPTIAQQLMLSPVGWAPNSKWITFGTSDGIIYIIDINGENLTAISGPGKHSNPTWSK